MRFRNGYLSKLVQRPGSNRRGNSPRDLQIGEVVSVGTDGEKWTDGPLARAEEDIAGRDGKIRVVKLRGAHQSILVGPVSGATRCR